MSHYTHGTAKVDTPDCLILALGELGFQDKLEVHAEPQALYGFMGDERPERAHVIIRRQHLDTSANDVGFLFKGDGTCEAIISDYDRNRLGPAWIARLEQLAAVHAAMLTANEAGHRISREVDPKTGEEVLVVTGGRW